MELTSFTDYPARRARLFNSVQEAVTTAFPIQNDRYTIQLDDVQYKGPERYSLSDQKKAILGGKSLTRKLAGRWTVTDNATGSVVSKSPARTVMNVPYLTNRGTYIRNGTEYSVSNQFRLLPSVYTRRTDDGKLESQFNVKARTGSPFRVFMEPRTSVFYMRYRGRKVPLYPLLHAMGVEDEALESTWGKDIVKTNRQYLNSPHAARFIKSLTEDKQLQKTAAYGPDVRDKLHGIFNRMELDEDATEATLGRRHRNVTSDTLLDSTRKILRMSRQEAEGDDRDSLEYQTIHGTADFLADKVRQDQQGLARKLLWKVTHHNGAQDRIPASFMDKHVDHLFNLSGLSQVVEEINPMELYDQNQRVVRLGEGGISSVQAVPKEARNVQPR
jgi:DNA-directed RNA polymerase beta subunit